MISNNTLAKDDIGVNANHSIILEIKRLLERDWTVTFEHIYRDGNRCADLLESHGATLPLGCFFFDDPIPSVRDILCQDITGTTFPRLGTL